MGAMNAQIKPEEIAKIMGQFEQESMKMDMSQEISAYFCILRLLARGFRCVTPSCVVDLARCHTGATFYVRRTHNSPDLHTLPLQR